jgi:hypothetical protein
MNAPFLKRISSFSSVNPGSIFAAFLKPFKFRTGLYSHITPLYSTPLTFPNLLGYTPFMPLITLDLPAELLSAIPGDKERFIRAAVVNELSGDIRRAKSIFGRLGGRSKSEKKTAASRINGRLGGRPPSGGGG